MPIRRQGTNLKVVTLDARYPDIPIWVRRSNGLAFADLPKRTGGRMPDFCIIGSAKAGTTSLDHYLGQHPKIFTCKLKEPHYFSTQQLLDLGDDWYKGLYAEAQEGQLCGEASTSYTRFPLVAGTAQRLYEANPDMKLIYILRNPVDRVQSEVLQTIKFLKGVMNEDLTHLSLDEALDFIEDPASPHYSATVETSKYDLQVKEFETYFDPSRLLLLCQSELRHNLDDVIRRVCAFLDLPAFLDFDHASKKNVTSDFLDGLHKEDFSQKYSSVPGYGAFKALLPEGVKDSVRQLLGKKRSAENLTLSPARRAQLEAVLEPHAVPLQDRVGVPWSKW